MGSNIPRELWPHIHGYTEAQISDIRDISGSVVPNWQLNIGTDSVAVTMDFCEREHCVNIYKELQVGRLEYYSLRGM